MLLLTCLVVVLMSPLSPAYLLLDPWTGRPAVQWSASQRPAPPRSDYISPAGTPLYKLRQRNPYGG